MGVTNPIEHLAMAPKSLTTSIRNVTRIQKEEMMQTHTAQAFQNEVKKSSEQTVKSQKSEYTEYRYDRKDESKQGKKQGQKRKQEDEPVDEDDIAAMLGRTLDICI